MKKISLSAGSRCLVASVLVLMLGQQAAVAGGNQPHEQRIKGIWNVRVNITNCLADNVPGPIVFTSFNAINVFAADGTFLDANSVNPATQSTHLGHWRHVRGNRYEFAEKFFLFDAGGLSIGWRIVRHEVVLARDADSLTRAVRPKRSTTTDFC
jgi:hypothetical protein